MTGEGEAQPNIKNQNTRSADQAERIHVSVRLSPTGELILRRYTVRRGDVAHNIELALQYVLQDDRAYQLALFPRDHSGEVELEATSVRLAKCRHQQVLQICQRLGISISVLIEAALIEADAQGLLTTWRNRI